MDARDIEKLVAKAKDDIIKEVNDRLPRKVGVTAVNHFKQNFRDGGWLGNGLHPWNCDTMCFYFHNPKLFDERKMKKSINYFRHFRTNDGRLLDKDLKHVVCVIKGRKELIEYEI